MSVTLKGLCGAALVGAARGLFLVEQENRPKVQAQETVATSSMELSNHQDLQYTGAFQIGGQTLRGIFDTGSFDLVVFPDTCQSCYMAKKYRPLSSQTRHQSPVKLTESYGSGDCQTQGSFDDVTVGTITASQQLMWEAKECRMPVLQQAYFHAVVGLGPPGWHVQGLEEQIRGGWGDEHEEKKQLELFKQQPDLVGSLGAHTFSQCLGKPHGSPGMLLINEQSWIKERGAVTVPVMGKHTWSVRASGFKVGSRSMPCKNGCKTLLDTGTSLLGVPSNVYESLWSTLDQNTCDLSKMPNLQVILSGRKTLTLTPDTYVGDIYNLQMASNGVRHLMHLDQSPDGINFAATNETTAGCRLLVMDFGRSIGSDVQAILGMPLFRNYLTSFKMGATQSERSVTFSDPSKFCQQQTTQVEFGQTMRRQIDASKILLPRMMKEPANLGDAVEMMQHEKA